MTRLSHYALLLELLKGCCSSSKTEEEETVSSTSRGSQDCPLNAGNFQITVVIIWKGKHILNVRGEVKKVSLKNLLPFV